MAPVPGRGAAPGTNCKRGWSRTSSRWANSCFRGWTAATPLLHAIANGSWPANPCSGCSPRSMGSNRPTTTPSGCNVAPCCGGGNRLVARAAPRRVVAEEVFGCQSATGCRFVERIVTVVQSLRLQGRNTLEFLGQTLSAHRQGLSIPQLCPVG